MLDKLTFKEEPREKKAFYAGDTGKPLLDLYFSFRGEKKTNPPKWHDTLKWGAGLGVEDSMLHILKDNNIVNKEYDQKENGRIDIEREGVPIHGYMDAVIESSMTPIEIKSINNANRFDIKRYDSNEPRENYVGQLAVYMDGTNKDTGNLFVSSIDGLHRYWFEAKRVDRIVKCGNITVDLDKIYKRWHTLYFDNILKQTPPDIWEYIYKIPVEKVDWDNLSKSAISKARNNQSVVGDWQIQYSPWKDLIIKLQGETLGYSDREIEYIKETTRGFSTR